MLKITTIRNCSGATLKLEGQLAGPWVDELDRSCRHLLEQGVVLRLDLADVSFADRAGAGLVASLRESAVVVTGCSPFLQEQLRAGPPDNSSPAR